MAKTAVQQAVAPTTFEDWAEDKQMVKPDQVGPVSPEAAEVLEVQAFQTTSLEASYGQPGFEEWAVDKELSPKHSPHRVRAEPEVFVSAGDITQSTDVKESEEPLSNGGMIQRRITTTEHFRPITERINQDDVETVNESREIVGVEIEEDITEYPPGVTEPYGEGIETESSVEDFEETLPDGTWRKRKVTRTIVQKTGFDGVPQNEPRKDEHPAMPSTMPKLDPYSFPVDPTIAFHIPDGERRKESERDTDDYLPDQDKFPSEPSREDITPPDAVQDSTPAEPIEDDMSPEAEEEEIEVEEEEVEPEEADEDMAAPKYGSTVSPAERFAEQTLAEPEHLPEPELLTSLESPESGIQTYPEIHDSQVTTDKQDFEEVLPDGTVVRKTIVKTKETTYITDDNSFPQEAERTMSPHEKISQKDEQPEKPGSPGTTEQLPPEVYTKDGDLKQSDMYIGEPKITKDVQEFEEVLPDGTVVKRTTVKTEQLPRDSDKEIQEFKETLPDGTVVSREIIKTSEVMEPFSLDSQVETKYQSLPAEVFPGGTEGTPKTDVQEIEEVLPDGTVIKKRIVKTSVGIEFPEGEYPGEFMADKNQQVEEITETLPDGTQVTRRVIKSVQDIPATEIVDDRIPSYSEVIDGKPEVKTDVQEFEETLPDGTVVRRKIVKTLTKMEVEGPEGEIPTGFTDDENQKVEEVVETLPDGTQVTRRVVKYEGEFPSTEMTSAGIPGYDQTVKAKPEVETDVQEFEETLPDGTVVRRKVVKTLTTMGMQGPEGEIPTGFTDNENQKVEEVVETLPDGTQVTRRVVKYEGEFPSTEMTSAGIPGYDQTVKAKPEVETDVQEFEETLPDGTVVRRKVVKTLTTMGMQGPEGEIPTGFTDDENQKVEEVVETLPDGTQVTRRVVKYEGEFPSTEMTSAGIPGYDQTVKAKPEVETDVQEFEETLPDGTVVRRKVVKTLTTMGMQGPEGEIPTGFTDDENQKVEEVVETLPDGTQVTRRVVKYEGEFPSTEMTSAGIPGYDQTVKAKPEVETDVQEFEETLPDGTVVRRKVVKTLTTMGMQSPEGEIPTGFTDDENQKVEEVVETLPDGTQVTRRVVKYEGEFPSTEMTSAGIPGYDQTVKAKPEVETDVQEFEETLPDGTVVRRKVVKTLTTMGMQSPEGEIPTGFTDDENQKVEEVVETLPDGTQVTRRVVKYEGEFPSTEMTSAGIPGYDQTVKAKPEVETDVQEFEETLPDGTVVRRKVVKTLTTMGMQSPEGEIPTDFTDDENQKVEEVVETLPDGTQVTRRVVKYVREIPATEMTGAGIPGYDGTGEAKPEVETDVQEFEETLPDGTVVRRKVVKTLTTMGMQGPEGEIPIGFTDDENQKVEEVVETLPDGTQVTRRVVKYVREIPATEMTSAGIPGYTEIIEGTPETETDVQEFEETLPDGTVVKRKVVKTQQKQSILTTTTMEGQEGEIPAGFEGKPGIDQDVQEFEETLPDGTVVRRKVVKTFTTMGFQGPEGDIPTGFTDDENQKVEEVVETLPDGTQVTRRVVKYVREIPATEMTSAGIPGYTEIIEGTPETETDVQEFEETLPDGTVVKRKVVKTQQKQSILTTTTMEGQEGEIPAGFEGKPGIDQDVQEFEETLPDGTVVRRKVVKTFTKMEMEGPEGEIPTGFRDDGDQQVEEVVETLPDGTQVTRRVVKYVREIPATEMTSAGIPGYTEIIEGTPETETDVQEFEETLPDGTVVKRKVVKTQQKQSILTTTTMEGQEGEIPAGFEGKPGIDQDVQEFEETLPDGTVVRRKVIKTFTRMEMEGPEGEIPEHLTDDGSQVEDVEETLPDGTRVTRRIIKSVQHVGYIPGAVNITKPGEVATAFTETEGEQVIENDNEEGDEGFTYEHINVSLVNTQQKYHSNSLLQSRKVIIRS